MRDLKELRQEICKYTETQDSGGNMIRMTEVVVTVGGSEAIDIAMRCMLDPGDEVLIPQPSYVSYLALCRDGRRGAGSDSAEI